MPKGNGGPFTGAGSPRNGGAGPFAAGAGFQSSAYAFANRRKKLDGVLGAEVGLAGLASPVAACCGLGVADTSLLLSEATSACTAGPANKSGVTLGSASTVDWP